MRTGRPRVISAAAAIAAALAVAPFAAEADGLAAPADTTRSGAPDTLVRSVAGDTLRSRAPGDTLRAGPASAVPPGGSKADSLRVVPREEVWTMDELKQILGTEAGGGAAYQERRSGRTAMLCALVFPGLGQMYNEKPLKAAIAMGFETFYVSQVAQNRRLYQREKEIRDGYPVGSTDWKFHDAWVTEYWEKSVDWIWWSAAVMFVIVVDAYVDAHLDDMRFRVEPVASSDGAGVQFVVRI